MPKPQTNSAAARAYTTRRGFPPLKGSPAQIEWAEVVRVRLMKNLDRQIRSGQGQQRTAYFQQNQAWMLAHTDAAWWIERRHQPGSTIARGRHAEYLQAYAILLRPA